VEDKLGSDYEITVKQLRLPEIKIIGMNERLSEKEIERKLKAQNEFIMDFKPIEVLKIEESKFRKDVFNVIIKVDPSTFNNIMEVGRVNIGWSRCRVVENIRITRCFKCSEYGHRINECQKTEKCGKCGGDHKTPECKSSKLECVNCLRAKNNLKLNLSTDHPVWSTTCHVYKRILEKRKKTIDYYEN
jgi:hypothetical protein